MVSDLEDMIMFSLKKLLLTAVLFTAVTPAFAASDCCKEMANKKECCKKMKCCEEKDKKGFSEHEEHHKH